jgi:hypothetical protein
VIRKVTTGFRPIGSVRKSKALPPTPGDRAPANPSRAHTGAATRLAVGHLRRRGQLILGIVGVRRAIRLPQQVPSRIVAISRGRIRFVAVFTAAPFTRNDNPPGFEERETRGTRRAFARQTWPTRRRALRFASTGNISAKYTSVLGLAGSPHSVEKNRLSTSCLFLCHNCTPHTI